MARGIRSRHKRAEAIDARSERGEAGILDPEELKDQALTLMQEGLTEL
jgi:hypothetical protein